MENCWLAKTDPKDVARVESKTVICTDNMNETIPTPADGVEGKIFVIFALKLAKIEVLAIFDAIFVLVFDLRIPGGLLTSQNWYSDLKN